jgi:hypothetical protein
MCFYSHTFMSVFLSMIGKYLLALNFGLIGVIFNVYWHNEGAWNVNQRSQTGYTLRICPQGTPHYQLMEQYLHPSGLLVFLIALLKQAPRRTLYP